MSVAEVLSAAEEYLGQGMRGIKMKVGHDDPRIDVARVREVRQALGEDAWIAVDANQKWDFATALQFAIGETGRVFKRRRQPRHVYQADDVGQGGREMH